MGGYVPLDCDNVNEGEWPTAAERPFNHSHPRHYLYMIPNVFSAFSETLKTTLNSSLANNSKYVQSVTYTVISNILPRVFRERPKQAQRAHDTAYLDALRGWAALIVWISHTFPYKHTWVFELPFTAALIHGRSMTMVFFVISGYALSYRMLKLIRTRRAPELFETFISSVFRRHVRLFGSAGIATFAVMVLVWLGFNFPSHRPEPLLQQTLYLQLKDWFFDFARFINPLGPHIDGYLHPLEQRSIYLFVTWTIPIEFRGSMLLFGFCIGTCKLSTINRMVLCWIFMICSYFYQVAYVSMFLGGLFIADLSFTRHPERLSPPSSSTIDGESNIDTGRHAQQSRRSKVFYSIVLVIAIFLLGQPGAPLSQKYWPWPILDSLRPPIFDSSYTRELWYLGIGSLLLVWALDSSPILQKPLKWNFSQYIGELSFGIYITHTIVTWTIYQNVLLRLQVYFLGNSFWSHAPVVPFHLLIMLWVAEIFTKVDQKVIRFAKWCQTRLFVW